MTRTLGAEEWRTLLDRTDGTPTYGALVDAVARADMIDGDPGDLVDAALAEGPLAEDADAGIFGEIHVARDDPDPANTPNTGVEDTDSTDANPGVEADKPPCGSDPDAVDALADALDWFAQQLDAELPDAVAHDTAREYYRARGWTDETIDEKLLGYAPGDTKDRLLAHLHRRGYDPDTILATGLFRKWDDGNLSATWAGRFVLPYFDADGRPVFAISRASDPSHPSDWAGRYDTDDDPVKYHKLPVSRDGVTVEEPIYGLDTVEPGEPVLITEGIADAITAHQAGYACVSPVTTSFKKADRERLVDALDAAGVSRVYIVQDAERPTSDTVEDREEWDALTVAQHGEGEKGAVRTAAYLSTHGIDARIGDLPRPGLDKVDLDDYLTEWDGDLRPILASARPVEQHPAYDLEDTRRAALDAADATAPDTDPTPSTGRGSALFDLDIQDVTGLSEGYRGTNPLGHHGESENYFVVYEEKAYEYKYTVAYNALTYLLVDAGVRPPDRPNGSLDDAEIFAAWKHAKEAGLLADDDPIPRRALQHVAREGGGWDGEHVEQETGDGDTFDALPTDVYAAALDAVREEYDLDPGRRRPSGRADPDADPVAVLPAAVRDLTTATSGWDWKHAARDTDLTKEAVRERTTDAIADAYEHGDRVLIRALPTTGKSYGSPAAAARTGEPITVLTGRGRKEQYAQYREWCDEHGLDHYTLPSFTRDCDTANGEHGQEWADTVREWYNRGATPKEIHAHAEYVLDRPLPCQEHEGQQCPYTSKWDFDPDEYDVLIGHYTHAYRGKKVTTGRTVVFDEFPGDAYETGLANTEATTLQGAVSYWLETTDGVPFENYTDLIQNRTDESRRADALLWFEEHGVEPDELQVFDDSSAHADAPVVVFTLLTADDLGNGFEQAELPDGGTGVFNQETGRVSVLQPPDLSYASGVVGLDGTPTKELWELSLGERLNTRDILQEEERPEYIRDALNLNIVRTSEYVKPYNSPEHVNTDRDGALLETIRERHGERAGVITTTKALEEYDADGVLEHVGESKHYGNVLGSNEFKEKRLGAVIGSNHYGDGFIQKWGAYAGESVPGGDDAREGGDKKGADLSYGRFGDKVLTHMREHETLQAVMRFGRDGNGAVVYTHTDTLPEWVPIAGEGRVTNTRSDGERAVISALEDLGTATTEAVVEHPAVELSRQQVFTHLERLRERGVLDREQDTEDGRRFVWRNDGLHRLNEHGEVELDPVEIDELDEEMVRQVARSSIYTWNFTNSTAEDVTDTAQKDTTVARPALGAVKAPGPPE